MSDNHNRSIYSLLNALSAICLTLVNGLLGIVVTRMIIENFGSDFNGLNSTANQVVHVLMIVEGGFTTASNVALFSPYVTGDYELVNGILSATRKKFRRIGSLFFAVGTVIALGYALIANSALPREFIFTVIMMTMIPPAFNLFYATTYRVLLQAQQKEYVFSFITACTIGLGHICNIVMILNDGPMWMVRVNTMSFALLNVFILAAHVKKANKFLALKTAKPRGDLIKGTNDVMAQRITSVIYDSSPLVFLSASPTGGTVLASVYSVYNNVFIIIKSLIRGAIDAPRLSIGQILTQRKRERVWPVFAQYQYAAFSVVFVLLTTTCALIMPFVELYTQEITDAQYRDLKIAVMMVVITTLDMIHMPSSHLLNMAGEFKICRNIQIITCIVLLLSMGACGIIWGIYGMLFSLLLVTSLLDVLEIGYVHTRFFPGKIPALLKLIMPLAVIGTLTCIVELQLPLTINSYLMFVVYGIVLVAVNGFIALAVGMLFNRKELMAILKRVISIVRRK